MTSSSSQAPILTAKEKQEEVWKHLLGSKKAHCDDDDDDDDDDQRQWPSYNEVLNDIRKSDYNELLTCPHDIHPGKAKIIQEKKNGFRRRMHRNKNQHCHREEQHHHHQKVQVQEKRHKTICPQGVVCCAKLELFSFPSNNNMKDRPYTGLLSPGRTIEHCVVRLSSVIQPLDHKNKANKNVAKIVLGDKLSDAKVFPGVALKIFRSNGSSGNKNTDSGNLLCLGCKVGQPEEDFFAHCVSSQITSRMPVTLKPILQVFKKYSKYPLAMGISNLCQYDADGNACDDVNFPFCLTLRPVVNSNKTDHNTSTTSAKGIEGKRGNHVANDTIQYNANNNDNEKRRHDSFLDDILSIPPGTVLYDIFASPDPLSVVDPTKLQRIGRLITTSEMIQSPPNDGLFFRHQKKDEDFTLRPNWKEDYINTTVVLKSNTNAGGDGRASSATTKGTVATLAGWELFEEQINAKQYEDFENS